MNDLSVPQGDLLSVYNSSPDLEVNGGRRRRPTIAEMGRVVSDSSANSSGSLVSPKDSSDQLRSMESIVRLRSLSSSQTASVATSDSGGSAGGEERKFKDDNGKRAMIVREIVEYVTYQLSTASY